MPAPPRRSKPLKIDPTPHYPHIVLALTLINTTPPRFHWLVFIPNPDQGDGKVQDGIKVHAIQLPQPGNPVPSWHFDAAPFTLATSASVAAAAVIGQLKDKTAQQLVELLAQIPMAVPAALRRLHGAGFIHCPDVDALEQEMWEYGVPAAQAVENETFQIAKLVTARNSRTP